jgi:hypothetical protein
MEGVKVYEEFVGDVHFQVYQRSSWFDILANGNVISKHQGRVAATEALQDWREAAYKRIEKLPTPMSVRSDVGKLIASIIQTDFTKAFGIGIDTLQGSPALTEHYAEAAKGITNRAAFAASLYSVHAIRTRAPMTEAQKSYFANLQVTRFKLPRGWKGYYAKIQRYAESVAANAVHEGGVNALWSQ